MGQERRIFERESVKIPFIYCMDNGQSFSGGDWKESITVDIGPVLVGGLAFYSTEEFNIGDKILIALFMDLELKKVWENEPEGFPAVYHGRVCRITEEEEGRRVAILFRDMNEHELSSMMDE